jgi:hypothetical protein
MEEEGTFFPKIADSVDNEELEKLGHQLQSAKETPLQDEMAA